MSNDVNGRSLVWSASALFALIALLIAFDLFTDRDEGVGLAHVMIEFAVLIAAVGGIAMLLRAFRQTRSHLVRALGEAERWRSEHRELVRGLGAAIQSQFAQWGLTEAEGEIGLFLLKGLSHKEIAEYRRTSERTVREQARALYRKSGLAGRNELSAFFLEELVPAEAPRTDAI